VVIGSKFVIVFILALAADLISEEGADVEHILAASALMLLACFAPFRTGVSVLIGSRLRHRVPHARDAPLDQIFSRQLPQ
jgi:hypothetical protein